MSFCLIWPLVPLPGPIEPIRSYSGLLHLLEMNVFTFLDDKLFGSKDRLIMISWSVFLFILIVLIAFSVILFALVLRVIPFCHQSWFECAMMEKLLILVLLASNLNELFFILVHFDTSLVQPSAWVHYARKGVIVAVLSETGGTLASVEAIHGFIINMTISRITHLFLGSLSLNQFLVRFFLSWFASFREYIDIYCVIFQVLIDFLGYLLAHDLLLVESLMNRLISAFSLG